MSEIPSDLFFNILCRVPAEYLLLFRCVCKSWRRTIDDPKFIKSHTFSPKSGQTLGQILIRNTKGGRLSCLSLDSLNFDLRDQNIEVTHVKNIIRSGVPRLGSLPVASCNGLILISDYMERRIWVLWNPLTQESYELHLPQFYVKYPMAMYGLGYNCVDDDYKVVRISYQYGEQLGKTSIFSLKTKEWKLIKEDCPSCSICWQPYGVYVNGSLYWISSECIIALDIRTEYYRQLPLPPSLFPRMEMTCMSLKLEVFDGCLVLSYTNWSSVRLELHGWVMNDNDDHGNISWTRLFSYSNFDKRERPWPKLVTYCKSNQHVLIWHDNNLFWFDINNNSAKRIQINDVDGVSCQAWVPSLCRLKDTVTVAKRIIGAKRKRVKKR